MSNFNKMVEGFVKRANEAGVPSSVTLTLLKRAFSNLTPDDYVDLKNSLGDSPDRQNPARALINERDENARHVPELAPFIQGGLTGGIGAGLGNIAGTASAEAAHKTLRPEFGKHYGAGGRGRLMSQLLGTSIGAVAGAIPGAMAANHRNDIYRKLHDSNNLRTAIQRMSLENALSQQGGY